MQQNRMIDEVRILYAVSPPLQQGPEVKNCESGKTTTKKLVPETALPSANEYLTVTYSSICRAKIVLPRSAILMS